MIKKLLSTILFAVILLSTSVSTFRYNLSQPCGLSEHELSKRLKYDLVQYADDFLKAENEHGVNACFLAAVASLESGHGRYCFRPNNIFGWSGKDFENKAECVDFVSSKIAEHYLSDEGKYYNGKNLSGVNVCYNGNVFWETKVAEIMAMISGRIEKSENG